MAKKVAQAAGQSWNGRAGAGPGGAEEDFPSLLPSAPGGPAVVNPSSSGYRQPSAPAVQVRPAVPARPVEQFPSLPVPERRPVTSSWPAAPRPVKKPASTSSRPTSAAAVKSVKAAAANSKPTKPVPKKFDPFDSDSGEEYPVLEVMTFKFKTTLH